MAGWENRDSSLHSLPGESLIFMTPIAPILLLIGSNVFMTYAWYGHLKDHRDKSLAAVVLISWGIAFFEYCLQVPANRLGHGWYSLGQLKVLQEVITMTVFGVFAMVYMRERLTLDFLWAGLCLAAASYFMFRGYEPQI
jgi:uncharacterized protein (DUF486 family)